MRRALPAVVAVLAATPAAAVSVTVAGCNGQSADLSADGSGAILRLNGEEVALEPEAARWEGPFCVSRDGATLFGLVGETDEGDRSYFLLDPVSGELAPILHEEAEALGFFEEDGELFEGELIPDEGDAATE